MLACLHRGSILFRKYAKGYWMMSWTTALCFAADSTELSISACLSPSQIKNEQIMSRDSSTARVNPSAKFGASHPLHTAHLTTVGTIISRCDYQEYSNWPPPLA